MHIFVRRFAPILAATFTAITSAFASPLPALPFFQHIYQVTIPGISLPLAEKRVDSRGATFIENRGQWDRQVKFLMKSPGLDMWITERGVRYDLFSLTSTAKASERGLSRFDPKAQPPTMMRTGHVVDISFEGASFAPVGRGIQQQRGAHNYFIGNDPKRWASGVRLFAEARLENLYDGIDALFYLDQGHPRYDLVVQPGADPSQVEMRIEGSNGVSINADGSLAIATTMGVLQQRGLYAYQEIGGIQRQVECSFVIGDDGEVGFKLGSYDRGHALVIDPLVYSTYVGGDANEESYAIAIDTAGNAYITGSTGSSDFPKLHEYQTNRNGDDVFVTKLTYNDSGNVVLGWSTYLGGIMGDAGYDIAVDDSNHVYVTGQTPSTDFPMVREYHSSRGGTDVFVTKFAQQENGSVSLIYSTGLGGNSTEAGWGITVDRSGNAYITGNTTSANFPTSHQYQKDPDLILADGFVAKLTDNGSGKVLLAYSTYLGGDNTDLCFGIALDPNNNPCVIGVTTSTDFPTAHEFQPDQTGQDIFVTKLTTNDSGNLSLVYSTYLGGDDQDFGTGIAADDSGNVYITGYTASTDFPTVNEYQNDQERDDAVVAKLVHNDNDTGAVTLAWSTYLGGDDDDASMSIAIDADGNACIAGYTGSMNFPMVDEDQTYVDGFDCFLARISNRDDGPVTLTYSDYLGASGMDKAYDVAVDDKGNCYLTGVTDSEDFLTKNPYQSHQTGSDAFVAKVALPIQLDVPAEPAGRTSTAVNHAVSPNPVHDNLRFSFTLPQAASVIMQIYTADGRLVSVPVQSAPYEAGTHSRYIRIAELPPGLYTLRVVAGAASFTDQFVVVR
jgi:hypothetical protein